MRGPMSQPREGSGQAAHWHVATSTSRSQFAELLRTIKDAMRHAKAPAPAHTFLGVTALQCVRIVQNNRACIISELHSSSFVHPKNVLSTTINLSRASSNCETLKANPPVM